MNIDTYALDFISLLIDHPGIVDMLQAGNERVSMPDYLSYLDILIESGHLEACVLLLAWGMYSPPVNQVFSDLFSRQITALWQQTDSSSILENIIARIRRTHRSMKKQQKTFASCERLL